MKKTLALFLSAPALICNMAWAGPVTDAGASAREAAGEYGAAVKSCDLGHALRFMYPPLKRTYADQLASRDPRMEAHHANRIMGIEQEPDEVARKRMAASMKALEEQYARMGKQMRDSGFRVERFTVNAPLAEYVVTPSSAVTRAVRRDERGRIRPEDIQAAGDVSRVVVLPTTLWYSTPASPGSERRLRIERKGFIYAVRDEKISGANYRGTILNKWYFIDGNTDVNTLRAYFPNLPLNIKQPDCGERPL